MSPTRELVSVITPTYNRRGFLPAAIESVLAQTYAHWELIIVDDGSTDGTEEVIRQYADSRIRYERQSANKGQATARNAGLRMAHGAYVCFLDSDNVWFPSKLEWQAAYLRSHPEVDVVYADGEQIDEDGNVLPTRPGPKFSGMIMPHLLHDNCVGFNTVMVRKSALDRIGGFDESVRYGDDYDLWLRMSPHSRFQHVPQLVCQYRVMPAQISSNKHARFESNRNAIERLFRSHPDLATRQLVRQTWAGFYARRARYEMSAGNHRAAFRDLSRSMRYEPASQRPWRGFARLVMELFPRRTGSAR